MRHGGTEMRRSMKQEKKIENSIRRMEAADERQYMIDEYYEIYEKQGALLGGDYLSLP